MTKPRHKWEGGTTEHVVEQCRICGLVRAEAWGSGALQPIMEYSTAEGAVISRGRVNKTPAPVCVAGKYFDPPVVK